MLAGFQPSTVVRDSFGVLQDDSVYPGGRDVLAGVSFTLPKTNSKDMPLQIGQTPKWKGSFLFNHPFSGASC